MKSKTNNMFEGFVITVEMLESVNNLLKAFRSSASLNDSFIDEMKALITEEYEKLNPTVNLELAAE